MPKNSVDLQNEDGSPHISLTITLGDPATIARLYTIAGARGITREELNAGGGANVERQHVVARAFADALVSGG